MTVSAETDSHPAFKLNFILLYIKSPAIKIQTFITIPNIYFQQRTKGPPKFNDQSENPIARQLQNKPQNPS